MSWGREKLVGAICTLLIAAGCDGLAPSQLYWDREIKQLCEKDGGVRVYEKISLSKEQYALVLDQFGQLSPPLESEAREHAPLVRKQTSTYLRRNDPEVRRDELTVVRKSDGKVLGSRVSYSRVGGDFVSLHPSYYSCPDNSADFFSLLVAQQ